MQCSENGQKGRGATAGKLQAEAAKIPPLVGLARSKQDLINCGHDAQYLQSINTGRPQRAMEYEVN